METLKRSSVCVAFLVLTLASQIARAQSPETRIVTYKTAGERLTIAGEVLREFGDRSMLLMAADGQLHTLHGEDVIEQQATEETLQPASTEQVIESLRTTLSDDFQFLDTKHYLIAYNTNEAYAQWVGQLFERLYRGFRTYWDTRRFDLNSPRFPLVAIVFRDKPSYLAFAQRDIGDSAQSMFGYYNMNSNRMLMYDLTGVDGLLAPGQRVSTQALVNHVLSQPQAERTVATIVHEAVHQVAFNTGLQVRLADNPLWLSEGLAMFFESPDLSSPQGWKMGNVNYHNLRLFANYVTRRPDDSLLTLIQDDERFKNAETARDAYAESWALTYFLIKARSKQFAEYLREIGKLEPLQATDPSARVEAFKLHFGDLKKIDRDFVKYLSKVRVGP